MEQKAHKKNKNFTNASSELKFKLIFQQFIFIPKINLIEFRQKKSSFQQERLHNTEKRYGELLVI